MPVAYPKANQFDQKREKVRANLSKNLMERKKVSSSESASLSVPGHLYGGDAPG